MIQGGPGVGAATTPDTLILTFGHVTPPAVPTLENEADAVQFAASNVAFVASVGKFSFTQGRLRELHDVIGQVISSFNTVP